MFQDSEIINLILAIISLFIIFSVFINKGLERLRYFYLGLFFVVGALLFTVIEGVFWKEFFNTLEHMCYALASIFFAAGVFYIRRWSENDTEGGK